MDQPERVRYFDQQFLRVDDFNAEQEYHRDMRRRHNRMLHTPGIAEGLLLIADGTGVRITPGSAIPGGTDLNQGGGEIVLAAERRQELSSFAANADVYVTIAFAQEETRFRDDAGVKGNTRWRESPVIEAFTSDPTATPPADPKQPWRVLLGRVSRGGTGGKNVVAIDGSGRRLAGAAQSEVSLTPRDPAVTEPDWVRLRWSARGQADLRGSLRIQPGGPTAGDLTVAGAATVGGQVRGPSLRIDTGLADDTGVLITPGALQFHVKGAAASTDVRLLNDAPGRLSIVAADAQVRGPLAVSGPLTVGSAAARQRTNLVGDLAIDRSMIFAGRLDGSVAANGEVLGGIGFYGWGVQHGQLSFRAGAGFELVDRSGDGPSLTYAAGAYPYADLRARTIRASGGLVVGAGGNAVLQTRHIDGKRGDNDNPDPLFLNWGTGQPVWVGGGARADLRVNGNIFLDADVNMGNSTSIRNGGRLHIFTEERLYLLARGAVFLTADWGGPGDLYTSGSIYCAGRGPGDRPVGHGAGIITWDLEAVGGVYSRTKQFRIDHPLDPERRHLVHACIEGPENGVYYRGEAALVGGEARIELPEYFEALTQSEGRTVLLTPQLGDGGTFTLLAASEVRDGAFTVRGDGDPEQVFWWEVKGVRSDIDRLDVEQPKNAELVSAM